MITRRKGSPAQERSATTQANIRRPVEGEGSFSPTDYAAVMACLGWQLPPGSVRRLLEIAEAQGLVIPEDLA